MSQIPPIHCERSQEPGRKLRIGMFLAVAWTHCPSKEDYDAHLGGVAFDLRVVIHQWCRPLSSLHRYEATTLAARVGCPPQPNAIPIGSSDQDDVADLSLIHI